ncbi:MAG: PAS domain S-box protein, partial [Burkholderiales bacterium]
MKRLTAFLDAPARMAIAVGLIVLVSEFLIMLLIEGVSNAIFKGEVSSIVWEFIDPFVLTALVSPALYILIFRPMRNRQKLLRMLSDTVAVGIVLNRGGKMLYVNLELSRLTGFTREELLGMEHWEVAHADSREVLRARVAARQRGEAVPSRYEFRVNTKNGAEAWAEVTAATIEYQGQRTVLGSFTDITERKLAEEALGHVHSDLEQLVLRRTAQLAEANLKLEEDVRQREQAGVGLLRHNAELTELNTRLGEAQQQLLQSEKMASIGQLAAGVAHEINNPIGYLLSNLGSLGGYLDDLFRILDAYADAEEALPTDLPVRAELFRVKTDLDLDFLREDIPKLMAESKEGITRVRKIVQ